jgi:hypothetical protein
MSLKSALALAVAVFAVAGVARAADVPADVQAALKADYALNCTTVMNPTDANFDAMTALMAPDFKNTDPSGKTETRDQVVTMGKQQMKMMQAATCDNTIVSETQSDAGTVVVVNTSHITGTLQAPDGKHQFDYTGKSQDTWSAAGGKWLETASKDLHVTVKVDGNVVQDIGD